MSTEISEMISENSIEVDGLRVSTAVFRAKDGTVDVHVIVTGEDVDPERIRVLLNDLEEPLHGPPLPAERYCDCEPGEGCETCTPEMAP